ncbi:hypothetical protein [Timonella senegalensis]|uniref:hypothetical protein n=1 Tax=Timonella senegalensis TaxID=1465825 RepID=UPI002FDD26EB
MAIDNEAIASEQKSPQVQEAIAALEKNLAQASEQRDTETKAAFRELAFPDGTELPEPDSLQDLQAEIDSLQGATTLPMDQQYGNIYEDGYFAADLANSWQCAWLSEAVTAYRAGDNDRVNAAVETLEGFPDLSVSQYFPDYAAFLEWHVNPIVEGDDTASANYLESDCSF